MNYWLLLLVLMSYGFYMPRRRGILDCKITYYFTPMQ